MRLLVLASVAAALLAGCGGGPQHSADAGHDAEHSAAHSDAPVAAGSGSTLVIGQQGTLPPRTAWYVRVETPHGETVTETGFPDGKITLTQPLKPGKYRVVVWDRPCEQTCPTKGEQGLGELDKVCGKLLTLAKGDKVTATVALNEQGGCEVRTD